MNVYRSNLKMAETDFAVVDGDVGCHTRHFGKNREHAVTIRVEARHTLGADAGDIVELVFSETEVEAIYAALQRRRRVYGLPESLHDFEP